MSLNDKYKFVFDIKPKPIYSMKDNIMPRYKSTSNTDNNKSPFEFIVNMDFRSLYPTSSLREPKKSLRSKNIKNIFDAIFRGIDYDLYFEYSNRRIFYKSEPVKLGLHKAIKNRFNERIYLKDINISTIFYIPDSYSREYDFQESQENIFDTYTSYIERSSYRKYNNSDLRSGYEIGFDKKSGGIFYEDI